MNEYIVAWGGSMTVHAETEEEARKWVLAQGQGRLVQLTSTVTSVELQGPLCSHGHEAWKCTACVSGE